MCTCSVPNAIMHAPTTKPSAYYIHTYTTITSTNSPPSTKLNLFTFMAHPLLLSLFLLFTSIHAIRDTQFFAKISHSDRSLSDSSIAEQPSTLAGLPPQSQNGYGLYARDPAVNVNNNDNNIPSSYTTTESYSKRYNIPSTFTNSEFSTNSLKNSNSDNDNVNSIPSTLHNAEFSTDNHKNNNNPSSFTGTSEYDVNDSNNHIPLTFSDDQFRRYENRNYPSYDKQYGMSDTRFLENGKYFYDVNMERNGGGYQEVKGNNNERAGSSEFRNEMGEYEAGQENLQESQEEYAP